SDVATYKVEPYVVAADVYTAPGHLGRGGWTWYTGSASWMYRGALEAILGFTRRGNRLTVRPWVPPGWAEVTMEYRYGASRYIIVVRSPGILSTAVATVTLDGTILTDPVVRLIDDGARHEVLVQPGPAVAVERP